jgi:hypothetical protein
VTRVKGLPQRSTILATAWPEGRPKDLGRLFAWSVQVGGGRAAFFEQKIFEQKVVKDAKEEWKEGTKVFEQEQTEGTEEGLR